MADLADPIEQVGALAGESRWTRGVAQVSALDRMLRILADLPADDRAWVLATAETLTAAWGRPDPPAGAAGRVPAPQPAKAGLRLT